MIRGKNYYKTKL